MPNETKDQFEIRFTPEFKRNLRALAKKYRHIRSDVQTVIDQLQAGNIVGEQVPHIGYTIYKVRVRNSDLQKGKSAGYRLLYYLQTNSSIILITIYSKSDQSDISSAEVRRIVGEVKPPTG
ncbi:MAG: type II toxin-antitoxin system RelE/ParE family toxin [Chloroflexi bacterium]|nr:type II toxin-antitoxin system RelE/ParE family toxin [Chloroflexota bacterium]